VELSHKVRIQSVASDKVPLAKLSTGTPGVLQAFIPEHLSVEWLQRLDKEVGEMMQKTGGYFDVNLIFRGQEKPITRFSYELRPSKTVA
jgi:hypothetical protein